MMRPFNVGIIGYGGFGKFLHHCWKQLEDVRVYALADKTAWKYEGNENVHAFSEWRNLVHDPHVDVVSIATVPFTHEMIASSAMEAGKAVLIEKPLATTIEDARKIIATRDRTGAIASIDYIMRYNPVMEVIAKLSRENVFGKIRRADIENYAQDEQLPPDHWFWKPDLAGGILIEHSVHFLDLVNTLSDQKPIKINGFAFKRNESQEDQVMLDVLFDKGLFETQYHSFSRPGYFEITTTRLCYDLATIDLTGWIPINGKITALVNSDSIEQVRQLPGFEITSRTPIAAARDESRPEGWGQSSAQMAGKGIVLSGGFQYHATELITGTFNASRPKQEIYSDCVQFALLDVVEKLKNPDHKMKVSLEDGLSSLEIAVKATGIARS